MSSPGPRTPRSRRQRWRRTTDIECARRSTCSPRDSWTRSIKSSGLVGWTTLTCDDKALAGLITVDTAPFGQELDAQRRAARKARQSDHDASAATTMAGLVSAGYQAAAIKRDVPRGTADQPILVSSAPQQSRAPAKGSDGVVCQGLGRTAQWPATSRSRGSRSSRWHVSSAFQGRILCWNAGPGRRQKAVTTWF